MRKLALLLTLVMVMSFGCVNSFAESEEPVEIFYVDRYGAHTEWDTTLLWQQLEEMYNVKITRKSYAAVDGSSWYALAILSGDTPAYISDMPTKDLNTYAKQGLFKELDIEMIKEYAPDMYDWWNTEWVDNWTDFGSVDGKLYAVPVLWSLSNNWDCVAIREDICEELGMEVPHTIDALEEFMAAAKETYNMDYVLTGSSFGLLDFVLGAYDVYRDGWYLGDDGELYWWTYHPNAEMAVEKLHDWYAAGYIDPEIQTNDSSMATERWASGKSFVAVSYWCNFVEAGTWGNNDGEMLAALKEANPAAKVAWVGTPTSEYGKGGWMADPWCGWFVFSAELSDEQLIAYLKCFNYCSQTEEGLLTMRYGIEGQTYTINENGEYEYIAPYTDDEERSKIGLETNFPENFNNYTAQRQFSTTAAMDENRHYWEDNNYTRQNILAATYREVWNEWGTAFKDYCDKNFIDFVVGNRDLTEWDAFIGELNTQYHGTELYEEAVETLEAANTAVIVEKYEK